MLSGHTGELVPSSKTESAIAELACSSIKETVIGEVVSSVKEEPAPVEAMAQRISEDAGIVKQQLHFQDFTGCAVYINMNF